jgi:hypothetical protein
MKSEIVRNMRELAGLLANQLAEGSGIVGDKRLAKLGEEVAHVAYILSEVQFKLEQGEENESE